MVLAQLKLDEAFGETDRPFAQHALQAFRYLGLQPMIVATARPVATVVTKTISEFTSLRREMRATAARAAGSLPCYARA